MKILFMSEAGDGLGIAHKMQKEGHEVRFWIEKSGYQYASLGLIERVPSWRPSAGHWAELIIADMVGFGKHSTTLDNFGVTHIGFNPIADMFELDRRKQMEVFQRLGITVPDTHFFDTPRMALELTEDWRDPGYVIKPSGNIDTAKTVVCYDADTYRWALEQYKGNQELIVQHIVEGIEVSTEGWFNGTDWIRPFNHTFEEKKFLEGNLGPHTGCMGNAVYAVKEPESDQLVRNIMRLSPFLRAAKYRGPVDLNTIVNENGVYALEATARIGYDAIEALDTLLEEPVSDLFMATAVGAKNVMNLHPGWAVAVRLSVPPFPHAEADVRDRDLPVLGVGPEDEDVYLTDVYWDKNEKLLKWAGADGVLLKVTAKDKQLGVARHLAYKKIDQISVLNLQYRRDIASRVESDLSALQQMKVLSG